MKYSMRFLWKTLTNMVGISFWY